jgi:hypothetical protein
MDINKAIVLRDILRKGKLNQSTEVEIDLRLTNRWIGKVRARGEFHRKTITTAIAQLDDKTQGMITILKRYNPWIYKILVRPLALVEGIQSAKCASIPLRATGNPMFDGDHKNRSRELLLQNISKLDSLFKKLGMFYNHESLMRIWNMAGKKMSEVKGAVEYMLKVHADKIQRAKEIGVDSVSELQEKGITTPRGWLIRCLEGFWHHKQQEALLPCLEGDYIYTFVDSLMGKTPPDERKMLNLNR